jgi:hypothetical protein
MNMVFDDAELDAILERKQKLEEQDSDLHADISSLIQDFPRAAGYVECQPDTYGWPIFTDPTHSGGVGYYITDDGNGYCEYLCDDKPGEPISTEQLADALIGFYIRSAKHMAGCSRGLTNLATRKIILGVLLEALAPIVFGEIKAKNPT